MENNKENFYLQQLKKDLRELKKYIEEFLIFLPIPVCSVNPMGILVDANRMFYEFTGYKRGEEIKGETIFRVEYLFEDKKKWQAIEKRILKKELIKGEKITIITADGRQVPVSLSASWREDDQGLLIGYFLAFIDITELKALQENLEKKIEERTKEINDSRIALMNILEDSEAARIQAEEERNKTLAIITNFADGLLFFDKEGKLSLINPQAEKFFELEGKTIIGKSIEELTTFSLIAPVLKMVTQEKGIKCIFRKEIEIKENLILEVSSVPVINRGENLGTLIILHDITREKAIEKMKTEFVSIAAHQLRTPLSAIKWTLRMLLDGDLGSLTEEQKEFLEKTYTSNERMIGLINDLLNVTRIEEGKYLFRPVWEHFDSLIQSVIKSYQEEIKRRKIQFELKKIKSELPKIKMDIEKMQLALQNLIDNAIKYTPPEGRVTIVLDCDEKEIKFQIQDTGIGIPKDQQGRVFTKFFRGANALRMETEGSGLGLFITKNIIEAHGGRIWFESEEGKGTTFFFTLPLKGAEGDSNF